MVNNEFPGVEVQRYAVPTLNLRGGELSLFKGGHLKYVRCSVVSMIGVSKYKEDLTGNE